MLRLASGRLFFCGDFQHIGGSSPDNITERGALAALSDDDGTTWRIKKLAGAQPHENPKHHKGAATLGYSVARQAPDGLIHIISTMNVPSLHFTLNEAWILSDEKPKDEAGLMASTATRIADVVRHEEHYPDGQPRFVWSAGIGDDGRYLLDGTETWFHRNGKVQYEAEWELGRKVGVETCYDADGNRLWEWQHDADGTHTWTQWWKTGGMKAQSHWEGTVADGSARRWDPHGSLLSEVRFVNGEIE